MTQAAAASHNRRRRCAAVCPGPARTAPSVAAKHYICSITAWSLRLPSERRRRPLRFPGEHNEALKAAAGYDHNDFGELLAVTWCCWPLSVFGLRGRWANSLNWRNQPPEPDGLQSATSYRLVSHTAWTRYYLRADTAKTGLRRLLAAGQATKSLSTPPHYSHRRDWQIGTTPRPQYRVPVGAATATNRCCRTPAWFSEEGACALGFTHGRGPGRSSTGARMRRLAAAYGLRRRISTAPVAVFRGWAALWGAMMVLPCVRAELRFQHKRAGTGSALGTSPGPGRAADLATPHGQLTPWPRWRR